MVTPEGIFSILDTDLYKLTMQCAVLKYFRDTRKSVNFQNSLCYEDSRNTNHTFLNLPLLGSTADM